MAAVLEKTKTIVLCRALTVGETRYEHLDLKEPALAEVEQFYELQRQKQYGCNEAADRPECASN